MPWIGVPHRPLLPALPTRTCGRVGDVGDGDGAEDRDERHAADVVGGIRHRHRVFPLRGEEVSKIWISSASW